MSKSNEHDFIEMNLSDDEYEVLTVGKKKDVPPKLKASAQKKNAPTQKNTAKNSSVSIRKKTRKKPPSNATVSVVSSDDENISDEEPPQNESEGSETNEEWPNTKE